MNGEPLFNDRQAWRNPAPQAGAQGGARQCNTNILSANFESHEMRLARREAALAANIETIRKVKPGYGLE